MHIKRSSHVGSDLCSTIDPCLVVCRLDRDSRYWIGLMACTLFAGFLIAGKNY